MSSLPTSLFMVARYFSAEVTRAKSNSDTSKSVLKFVLLDNDIVHLREAFSIYRVSQCSAGLLSSRFQFYSINMRS